MLVGALTGMELTGARRRRLTNDLGFAWTARLVMTFSTPSSRGIVTSEAGGMSATLDQNRI